LLLPLVPVYRAGLAVKDALRDAGVLKVQRLDWPVISVGSLSAGGAGKTPVVKMLARLLEARGVSVDVLSRGYGRSSREVGRVQGDDAARFGDEPVELARDGAAVWVGADRFAAGKMAESSSGGAGVHLLDDGFQHRGLARDLDVVLLTRQDLEDELLPAGNLREPLAALRRAQVVVVREEEGLAAMAAGSSAAVWVVRRRLVLPDAVPSRPLAFCGIARPEGFFAMLREAGCGVAGTVAFADHHAFGDKDFARLVETARRVGADGFVTTAKDEAKLGAAAMARLNAVGPVAVATLEVELVDEKRVLEPMLAMLRSRGA
jgi:tetraacyldisaccharide 4'-kinase